MCSTVVWISIWSGKPLQDPNFHVTNLQSGLSFLELVSGSNKQTRVLPRSVLRRLAMDRPETIYELTIGKRKLGRRTLISIEKKGAGKKQTNGEISRIQKSSTLTTISPRFQICCNQILVPRRNRSVWFKSRNYRRAEPKPGSNSPSNSVRKTQPWTRNTRFRQKSGQQLR